jgi:hypothetical protein
MGEQEVAMAKCNCGNEAECSLGVPIDICKECYDKIMGVVDNALDGPHPEDGPQTDVVYEARSIKPGDPKSHSLVVKKYRDVKGRRVTHFICQCTSSYAPARDAEVIAEALNFYYKNRKQR